MNIHELKSFNLADAVKFHRRLNPALWGTDEHLLPEVREKLLAVADDFREFLGVDDLKLVDITLSGSNAAYSYTANSDIDLHLVVEMPQDPVYQELFDAKKYQYNETHNIRIGGADVELYVQPSDQAHHSQGIYSIKNSDWLQVPQRRRARIDDRCVQSKTADLDARIHAAIKTKNLKVIDLLWHKIKAMRQTGLEKHGEFGCENIAFKLLRNQGCIAELVAAKTAARDQELSLRAKPRERKTVNYGMRDYWYPGTAYAGQDHPAGTESEQVDESRDINRKLSWSDLDPGLSVEDKIEIFETYIIKGNLFETNDKHANEYFLSLVDMCDHLIPAQKYIVVPLILINNRLMMLDQPGVMKFLGTHQHALKFKSSSGEKTFPSRLMRDMSVTNTFTFSDLQTYNKFRNIVRLKYDFDLPPVVLADRQGIKENINTDQLKKILNRFYSSCVSKLQLENPPQLRLETTPEWSQENGSFGQYDSDSNTLILATSGRHVLDILRTMAHEMTHRQQDEREPLPIDAGATGSPWEDQANAMAGRIMRDWAEEQPEMFDGVTLEEASGYIPTRKQARDPRFSMALTRDVRPGAVGREANKLGLKTDAQGHPALLMKSANTLAESLARELELFEPQDLFEINMGSRNLRQEAARTGALAGMEFEMIVPGVKQDDPEPEPDYDQDERCRSIDDAVEFFNDGDYNGRREVERLRVRMQEDFGEWLMEKLDEDWANNPEEYIYQYLVADADAATIGEIIGEDLSDADGATKQQVAQAAEIVNDNEQQPYYDDARAWLWEEYQDGWDESDWLDSQDLDTMSAIENAYDISWPHYNTESDVDIDTVANDFSDAIGRPVNASNRYHGGRREAGHYVVEPDGSLEPDDSNDQGLEFVSPPLPIDDMLSDLNKVVAWAKQKGCYTNESTGLHINVSVPGFSREKLDYVKLALLLGDQHILDSFGRAGNTYAKSALAIVKDNIRSKPGQTAALLTKMKSNLDSLATKAIHSGTTSKYTSINTQDGYVEFRSPGGNWLDDNFSKIEPTLLRFVVALDAAIDPEKYREEYLKKLYKLLTADNKDDSTIQHFVDYVAGKIPKAALRSFVKQAQLERQVKRGKELSGQYWWRVDRDGRGQTGPSIDVVATGKADALEKARKGWNIPDGSNAMAKADAYPLRPYEEPAPTVASAQPGSPGVDTRVDYELYNRLTHEVIDTFPARNDQEAQTRLNDYRQFGAGQSNPDNFGVRRGPGVSRTASGFSSFSTQTDMENRLGWPDQTGDANYEIVDRRTGRRVFVMVANTNATAARKYADWLAAASYPEDTEDYGYREISVPGAGPAVTPQAAPVAPAATTGSFTGEWRVLDPQDREIYRFSGVGNNQSDANRVAIDWMRRNPGRMQAGVTVVPVMSESRTQEDYDPSHPPGPESPPKMPAGTIKVDVSDMYDWYKLGQKISDLKSVDKSTLGKGPPSTVFAFGSEDLENMYSHALMNLGLKTHDLDEPGEEDFDEQIVTELKINNATGVGAVPYNQEIDYMGLRVAMKPSMFLRLALPLDRNDPEERKAIEYCRSQLDDPGIGAPFLTITVPEAWESDDFSLEARVRDHDGRHRCYAILEQQGDEPIEVHLLPSGGMRRRHITDSIIDHLRSGMLNQQGQYVSGPIFGAAK